MASRRITMEPLPEGGGHPMGLSAEEVREYLALDCCPLCGEGPWRAVAGHIVQRHGYRAAEVKKWAGLNRTTALISVELSAAKAETAKVAGLRRGGTGALGRRWSGRSQMLETLVAAGGNEPIELDNVDHGTTRAYRAGCRCSQCRRANAEHHRSARGKRAARAAEAERHGVATTYANWGCRCEPCRDAWLEHMRTRKRIRHASGVMARLDRLEAEGRTR